MAAFTWSLLSPPFSSTAAANSIRHWSSARRTAPVRIFAKSGDNEDSKTPSFNPFGFVTDNPSSKSAIQLPESPAEDGNVGQMISRIEDKGKEYGRFKKSGDLIWFVRETGSRDSIRGSIVFLHGAPTQSYSYRVVMSQMADAGFHCVAPDWIGFGFSDKPYPKYGFDYTEKEFHDELDKLLEVVGVKSPFLLVVQDSSIWRIHKPECYYGRAVHRRSYVLKLEKADVYRLPYLESSGPGFALLEAARRMNFKEVATQIAAGFASGSWDKPTLVAWGISDKYLPQSVAEEFQKSNPSVIKLKLIEGAGHMPQEDWPEKVIEALRFFFL
ncbi:uncharacterized protein LOC130812534 isoform X2 [Amaranthus tricolor]|uniref:uncharacterized protein LOC130812534 isoform X2 n=1 Tax=Amaranthus tricolor TaxID=29722 RepID=UPI0025869696|nr:uncharacterized protein LOC130812534 isoform X2 [Amaranthus tricolor]